MSSATDIVARTLEPTKWWKAGLLSGLLWWLAYITIVAALAYNGFIDWESPEKNAIPTGTAAAIAALPFMYYSYRVTIRRGLKAQLYKTIGTSLVGASIIVLPIILLLIFSDARIESSFGLAKFFSSLYGLSILISTGIVLSTHLLKGFGHSSIFGRKVSN